MNRNRVFTYNRSQKRKSVRTKTAKCNCDVQSKTIEYMEELGKMGHWTYDFDSSMVHLSNGALEIFKTPDSPRKTRYDGSQLNTFDEGSKQLLHEMTLMARKRGVSSKRDVNKLNGDGSVSKLRVIQGMSDENVLIGIVQDMTPWYDREKNIRDQLKLTQDIIDAIPIPMFMKNLDGEFKNCNKAFLNMLKMTRDQVIGKTAYDVGDPLDMDMYVRTDDDLIRNGGVMKYETQISKGLDKPRRCMLTKALLKDTSQRAIGIVGTLRDVTEDKKKSYHIDKLMKLKDDMMEITHAIMDNRSETDLFHLILDKGLNAVEMADHGTVLMSGKDGIFRPVAWRGFDNDSMESFEIELEKSFVWRSTNGMMDKSVLINDLSKYITENIPDLVESSTGMFIKGSLCSPIIVEGEVIGLMNLDSTLLNAFTDSDLALAEYMREQLEIALTKRKLYDKVIYLSRHDELTGLYNRRFFEEFAKRTLKRSQRYSDKFCLAVFDLNNLKFINDNYGHQCGDEVIKQFAQTLRQSFRETDILGRYGGDEFVGIFLESDRMFLKSRLEDILKRLAENPVVCGDENTVCSFSYGIASFPGDGDSYNKLVSVADKSMYDYKKAYKG